MKTGSQELPVRDKVFTFALNKAIGMQQLFNKNTPEAIHAILYAYLEKIRPPENIRHQVDLGYSFDGQVVFIFEIRPDWQDKTIIRHNPYAKIKLIKSKNIWSLYWQRASGKWISYDPLPESPDLEKLLDCVDEDKYCCFKG